jgi:hypothetical protein
MSGLKEIDYDYQRADEDEIESYTTFKEGCVYISIGITDDGKPEIEIIDLTEEGSDREQVFVPLAHSFVSYLMEHAEDAQVAGLRLISELQNETAQH